MKKLLLIDGNSMLFRAYYGTLSRGTMQSSTGVATNAVYGFSTMLNKAIEMMKPTHILVAFDTKDKTFRHNMFDAYKGTRKDVDDALVSQFALVREFLDAYPIQRFEISGFEADDVIGTLSQKYDDIKVEILTSDRDMLQLISPNVDVVLMKKGLTDLKIMNREALIEDFGLTPSQIVDVKALQGDTSDNIPGVPSIGEKTAIKLITQYGTFENLYNHKDEVKGKMGENLRAYEEQARLSYTLAKIICDVPIELELDKIAYEIPNDTLNAFYRKYDMTSLLVENYDVEAVEKEELDIAEFNPMWVEDCIAMSVDQDKKGNLQGVFLYRDDQHAYLTLPEMKMDVHFHQLLQRSKPIITLNAKPFYHFAKMQGINDVQQFEDMILLAFIVDSSVTTIDKFKDTYNLWHHEYEGMHQNFAINKSIVQLYDVLCEEANKNKVMSVYRDIEQPLTPVLVDCEFEGINVDLSVLEDIAEKTNLKIEALKEEIYSFTKEPFNINSPKQLGVVLFDELELPTKKKRSTAVDVLEGLLDVHPIIAPILEYRKYQKLYSTYAVGLQKHIGTDHKIHTNFNQHLATTGRLSSNDPNLQNISVRDEESREVRKAFVASEGRVLLSIDYSQIELRVLSYLADEHQMKEAFRVGYDIHEATAAQIFDTSEVTKLMRRQAKSVNFGIVYGISAFGLSKQLDISVKDASSFIDRYNEVYPGIIQYMDKVVEKCRVDGYVETLFGRRRYIPEIFDKNRVVSDFGRRAAMNAPIQGTAADIIKIAMVECAKALSTHKLNSKMILQVHDELVFDVFEEELEEVTQLMVQVMENIVDWDVPLKVSVSVGKNWLES